jgi:hypothetical protein
VPTAAGRLKLVPTDVEGRRLKESVDVLLQHTTLASATVRARLPAGKAAVITGLRQQPEGTYRIEVDPPSYLPVSRFVVIKSEGTTSIDIAFPVDPSKVKRVEFPSHDGLADDARRVLEASDNVLGFEKLSGAALYERLDDIRRAGLLNILAKLGRTRVNPDGRVALSFVQQLVELRGDRFFAVVQKTLREETKNGVHTGQFVEAPEVLHHPPDGFEHAGSFKTTDHFANLQLTFFARGDQWMADIDIDDANGVEHLFQVLRNKISGRPTHPYDIHELLVSYQKLDPGYTLIV